MTNFFTSNSIRNVLCLAVFMLMNSLAFSQVFWSESFDAGIPSTWTLDDPSGNAATWIATSTGPAGAFAVDPLHEAGSGETWILYDSDLDCSGNQDAWIISDAIDCSNRDKVWLNFDQSYRNFYDLTFIQVSTDLENWTEFPVNDITQPNDFGEPSVLVNLTPVAANEATVYIAFEFRALASDAPAGLGGCAYSWQVDNVVLTETDPRPENDMRVNDNFFAIAPNAVTPASQVEDFGFLADIENVGSTEQTNVSLNISIVDNGSNQEVYTEDFAYGTIDSDSIAENQLFPGTFSLSDAVTSYTGTYTISADADDADATNDTRSFEFITSEFLFAKETAPTRVIAPAESNWNEGDPLSWGYGNYFYMPNGDGFYATQATFGFGNADEMAGQSVTIWLYKWVDEDEDQEAQESERERVAFNIYTVQGNEDNDLITIDLLNFFDNSPVVPLEDDAAYILMVEYVSPDDQTLLSLLASEAYDYSAQVFRSEELGTPRYAGILAIGDNSVDYSTTGFGRDIVPVVRLTIADTPPTVDVKEPLADNNLVEMFPNPTNDVLNLNIDLVESTENMTIRILDVTGRVVLTESYNDIKTVNFKYDVSNLMNGTYLLNLTTDAGTRSQSFMVQK